MKLFDFDGLFDKKLTRYMEENKNKYTEKQWEDMIPTLYKKFGDTYVAKVQCTPKEYYARMSNEELVATLSAHLEEDVPVPEFLCSEIECRGETEILLPMMQGENLEAAVYAFNLIGDKTEAYATYFSVLEENRYDEDLRNDIVEIFKFHADAVKEKMLDFYKKGIAKEYALEVLSRVKERNEEIYDLLLKEFLTDENLSMKASYLAAYGDERALPILLQRIEDQSIGFVEFQELKYAIEALGGEYNEPRDFSADKDFLAVEVASAKASETIGKTGLTS